MPYITSVERLGIEQGIEQGQRRLLIHQIRKRFGAECAAAGEGILGRVHEPAELDRAGEWIVECESGAELLKRLQTLAGPPGGGPLPGES